MLATEICILSFFSIIAIPISSAARAAGAEIMQLCVEMGGTLSGEHGVGMEKNELMPLMFTEVDLELMRNVRAAFNPVGRLNPDKVLPLGKGCGETRLQPFRLSSGGPS